MLWSNMAKKYSYQIQKHLKGFGTILKNRVKILAAEQKIHNRLFLRFGETIQKYVKGTPNA